MRALMTFLTLGAGFAGYTYLQQSNAGGGLDFGNAKLNPSYDWNQDVASRFDTTRSSVKELVVRIHEHTKSILDEFTDHHSGYSDAPSDNAFERLRQVTQSSSSPFEISSDAAKSVGWSASSSAESIPNLVPVKGGLDSPATLDELHRIAFQPNDAALAIDEPAAVKNELGPSKPSRNSTIQVAAGDSEGTLTGGQQPLVPTNSAKPTETSSSRGSPTNPNLQQERPIVTATATPKSPPKPGSKNVGEWKVIGKTTEGRPMHSMHLGNRGTRTLIITGMDGEDRFAVRWLEQLAESISSQPELLDNNEIVLFRAANPDGLVHKVTENAHGVALNRNFPSRRYRPTPGIPSTAIPAGEVETRVILNTLYTFRPRRVIHLTSTSARSQLFYNRLAKEMAVDLERSAKVHLTPLDVELCPGSIEDFADGTLEAAVLSMNLGVGNDWQKSWTDFQPQILSSVFGKSPEVIDRGVNESQDPDRTRIPNANIEPVSRTPRRRGYEELPPPP